MSPTLRIASMTSSTGMADEIPASESSAAVSAFIAPMALRLTQGTSTSPATGSHISPMRFFSAMATAFAICASLPPCRKTSAAAAMADALPISA